MACILRVGLIRDYIGPTFNEVSQGFLILSYKKRWDPSIDSLFLT